jgi:multiple sugar transport system permease protein
VNRPANESLLGLAGRYGFLLLMSVVALGPLAWTVLTSLKPQSQVMAYPPVWIPAPPTLENYIGVIFNSGMPRYFANTLIVAAIAIAIVLVCGSLAAYAAARFRFRGRETVMFLMLATSMVPLVSLLTPLYVIWVKVGLYDSYLGMGLAFAAWQLPTSMIMIRGFIEAIPYEIEEAAMVDGCSRWQCFVHVVLPVIQPGLVASGILMLVFIWNDFLVGTALGISENHRLVQVGLYRFVGDLGVDWGRFTAYVTLSVVPVIVLFMMLRKRLVNGLVAGAVKG